jgi:putative spermidine/putrescine transport system permease protein
MRSSSRPLLVAYTVVVLAALVLPLAVLMLFAFSADSTFAFPPSGVSLRWFAYLADRHELLTAALVSVEIALVSSIAAVGLGLLASLALVRERVRGKAFVEGILMSPLTLPGIITGVAFLQFVSLIGVRSSFWRLVLAHIVICTPYAIRSIGASLYGLDPALEEASSVMGAGPWRTFRWILVPLVLPGITTAFIFAFVTSFDNVVVSLFLISGETVTLPIRILTYVEWQFDPSMAALSVIVTVFTTALILIHPQKTQTTQRMVG